MMSKNKGKGDKSKITKNITIKSLIREIILEEKYFYIIHFSNNKPPLAQIRQELWKAKWDITQLSKKTIKEIQMTLYPQFKLLPKANTNYILFSEEKNNNINEIYSIIKKYPIYFLWGGCYPNQSLNTSRIESQNLSSKPFLEFLINFQKTNVLAYTIAITEKIQADLITTKPSRKE